MVVIGISFVLLLFLVVYNALGLMSGTLKARHWRVIVLAIFVLTAIAVPAGNPVSPDPLTGAATSKHHEQGASRSC
jgi:sec-independent protein translocase protein TatC